MVLTGGEDVRLELIFETSTEDAVTIEREILAAAWAPLVGLRLELELVLIKEVAGTEWMELAVKIVVRDGVAGIDVPTLKEESSCGYSIWIRQATNIKISASQMFGSCESSTVIPKVWSCKGRPAVAHNCITDPIVTLAAYALAVATVVPSISIWHGPRVSSVFP
jgi:hypothetical protein